ncbi:MAG: diaminopimelate decarboxylase, partial [Bacteroidales bacterium]|nr:diaminopimelate decarboxylase [Bacteroidales bacterium]
MDSIAKFKIPELIQKEKTPFYFYNLDLLNHTLTTAKKEADKYDFIIHYAVKANANDRILKIIRDHGIDADCVSGNEIKKVIETGFDPEGIVFAGVGKSDWEIELALAANIFCFNCESAAEIKVINSLAGKAKKIANIALRINPNIRAGTHEYITTGVEENKFGIHPGELEIIMDTLAHCPNLKFIGLHFHIGSQITDLNTFKGLCIRVNQIQEWFNNHQIIVNHINVGGGFGIDYNDPDNHPVSDFPNYFKLFNRFLDIGSGQKVHFELGRSLVAQCGSLITKVLYIKNGVNTKFVIVDAGMTDLLRPALYQAYHKIENLTSTGKQEYYTIVGPICESSDSFGKYILLPETNRNDLLRI